MTRRSRLLLAFGLGAGLLVLCAAIYVVGMTAGVMATDGCPGAANTDFLALWLVYLWPVVLLLSALAPAVLAWRSARWYWILASIAAGAGVSAAFYLLWFPMLAATC